MDNVSRGVGFRNLTATATFCSAHLQQFDIADSSIKKGISGDGFTIASKWSVRTRPMREGLRWKRLRRALDLCLPMVIMQRFPRRSTGDCASSHLPSSKCVSHRKCSIGA